MAKEAVALQVVSGAPARVGVRLAALGKLNIVALKYLIVHLNTLQSSIEFEILSPDPEDQLLVMLSS